MRKPIDFRTRQTMKSCQDPKEKRADRFERGRANE